MSYYPIFVDLKGKTALVVGGGTVAQRKIETLLEYGAFVHVVSRELTADVTRYVDEGKIKLLGQEFKESYLEGVFLVISATDDPAMNHRVSECSKKKDILVNAVDQPLDCTFIVPAILKRGDLQIAVSTSGKSPALAKKVRRELEEHFGREYESLLLLLGRLRKKIISKGRSQNQNKQVFSDLVYSDIQSVIGKKDWKQCALILNRILGTELSPEDVINLMRGE